MTQKNSWWYRYGPFNAGNDNLPHMGDVISFYRHKKGWTIEQFADAYGCSVHHAQLMEGPRNVRTPDGISKRRLLQSLLVIPPALLGLSATDMSLEKGLPNELEMLHEDNLSLVWVAFYSGNFQAVTRNIATYLYMYKHAAVGAKGVEKIKIQTLYNRYLHVSSTLLREQDQTQAAIGEAQEAVRLSREIGNAENLVTSLLQLFRSYEQAEDYKNALSAVAEAESTMKKVGVAPQIAGSVYINHGEVLSNIGKYDPSVRSLALKKYDNAASIIRSIPVDAENPPGVYKKNPLSRVMLERATACVYFGMLKGATQDIQVARTTHPATNVRILDDIILADADIKSIQGDYPGALELLRESQNLSRTTSSKNNLFWNRRILKTIIAKEPSNTEARALLLSLG